MWRVGIHVEPCDTGGVWGSIWSVVIKVKFWNKVGVWSYRRIFGIYVEFGDQVRVLG